MVATKASNPTSRKAPSRLKGGEQAEAKPSHATRSSAVSNEAVRNPSTLRRVYPQSSRMSWVRDHRDSCDIRRRADPAPLITHRPFAKSYSTFCFAVTNICFTLRHHEDEGLQTTAAGRLLAGRLARAHAPLPLVAVRFAASGAFGERRAGGRGFALGHDHGRQGRWGPARRAARHAGPDTGDRRGQDKRRVRERRAASSGRDPGELHGAPDRKLRGAGLRRDQ